MAGPAESGNGTAVLEVRALKRSYERGGEVVHALDGVDFAIGSGQFVSVMGPSGSGKSTLLHLLGGLDTPTSGAVLAEGRDLASLSDDDLTTFRRKRLGFVFQFFNLLPTLSAWENVAVPRLLDGVPLAKEKAKAVALLERVGLGHRVDHRPSEMSGGQLQRVAIARALINDPVLVLADEPTGNLDSQAGGEILDLLRSLSTDEGRSIVMVTHDDKAAHAGHRILRLRDGRLDGDEWLAGAAPPVASVASSAAAGASA